MKKKQNFYPISTSIEQSKNLITADVPIGTADMSYVMYEGEWRLVVGGPKNDMEIPAWSLGALMNVEKQVTVFSLSQIADNLRNGIGLVRYSASYALQCMLVDNLINHYSNWRFLRDNSNKTIKV